MRSKKVLNILKISRQTLTKYVKTRKIRVEELPNGNYEYNSEDVYKVGKVCEERIGVIYSRVSTQKQKQDLENQEQTLLSYCNENGIKVTKSYKDIASGINFDRKEFQSLLNDVIKYKVSNVYITHKDRLSRVSFEMFKNLFEHFDCKINVLSELESSKSDEEEIFSEIISMLHCFSMRMYSIRRKKKLSLIKEDLENEISL